MRRILPLLATWLLFYPSLACDRTSPASPTPSAPPPPQVAPIVLNGQLTSAVTGQPLEQAGVTVTFAGQKSTTDAAGRFRYEVLPGMLGPTPLLVLSAPTFVERSVWLSFVSSRDVSIDVLVPAEGFDLAYYRKLVRNGHEMPDQLQPLRRWSIAPKLYIRTVDEAGRTVDPNYVNVAAAALRDEAEAWTGGRFGVAGIETGVETREGDNGWITVKWVETQDFCGRAQVAVNGGWIELNTNSLCRCQGGLWRGMVRHELGHAMGFWHTDGADDVLNTQQMACNHRPSARERFHAALAYSRAFGNLDPDIDPTSSPRAHTLPTFIVVD